jgi:hypothetical protein
MKQVFDLPPEAQVLGRIYLRAVDSLSKTKIKEHIVKNNCSSC